ncbi:UNVERIFIED_CONTAM: hypothetical protein GTU68_050017 [Idotea baltica]|nr:hypothetical protein [Idotea baltica]
MKVVAAKRDGSLVKITHWKEGKAIKQ